MHESQVVAAVIMVIFVVASIWALHMLHDMYCVDKHGLLCLFGTSLIGAGMLLYRLLRGLCSRQVKYFHMIVQLSGVIFIALGISEASSTTDEPPVHSKPAYIIYIMLLIQAGLALLLFITRLSGTVTRLRFAPFHVIFGVWIFLCLVGCCIAGTLETAELQDNLWNRIYFSCIYFGFLCVIVVVLSPYFEWELVGIL